MEREMLSEYQLKIADLYNIPIANVKKLVLKAFHKDKYLIHYENLQLYFRIELEFNRVLRIRIQSILMVPTILNSTKKNERKKAEKNNEKMEKSCINE